jgi:hypothetical protein
MILFGCVQDQAVTGDYVHLPGKGVASLPDTRCGLPGNRVGPTTAGLHNAQTGAPQSN